MGTFGEGKIGIASAVGGTASSVAGGKFANGAVTGLFVHHFNTEGGFAKRVLKYFGNKVDNVLSDARYVNGNGKTSIYEKDGSWDDAVKDLKDVVGNDIKPIPTKFGIR